MKSEKQYRREQKELEQKFSKLLPSVDEVSVSYDLKRRIATARWADGVEWCFPFTLRRYIWHRIIVRSFKAILFWR